LQWKGEEHEDDGCDGAAWPSDSSHQQDHSPQQVWGNAIVYGQTLCGRNMVDCSVYESGLWSILVAMGWGLSW